MNVIVSPQAVDRYVERAGGSRAAARAMLSGRAVQIAADFGARCIRIGHGRAIGDFTRDGFTVITVASDERLPRMLMPIDQGGPVYAADDPDFRANKDRSHAA